MAKGNFKYVAFVKKGARDQTKSIQKKKKQEAKERLREKLRQRQDHVVDRKGMPYKDPKYPGKWCYQPQVDENGKLSKEEAQRIADWVKKSGAKELIFVKE